MRHTFEHHAVLLRQVVVEPATAHVSVPIGPLSPLATGQRPPRPTRPEVQARLERRAGWEAIFQQVHELLARGMSVTAVARQLGIDL